LIVVLEIWCDVKAGRLKKVRSTSTKVVGVGELQEGDHEEWMPLACYKALRTDKAKSKGKRVWDKRSKYTSSMNNGHKLQGWSEAGKQRFNKLMVEVEDSRSNPTCQEVEDDMLEKWRSMDGKKYTSGIIGSQSTTSGGKMERMWGNGGRTALRLSAGAMERYGLIDSNAEMTGQLNFGTVLPTGNTVKDEPNFLGQVQV
jgi:hypothetical protein